MNNLEKIFNQKTTENGDIAYKSSGNPAVDLLFFAEYFTKNSDEIPFEEISSLPHEIVRLLIMFIRDPRFGMGYRDYGRILFEKFYSECEYEDIVKAGRWDDIWYLIDNAHPYEKYALYEWLKYECEKNNSLCKKWMPRISSGKIAHKRAKSFCEYFNLSHKDYSKLIKTDTVENILSNGNINEINYEHVPSLAMIKYYNTFLNKDKERFFEFLQNVKDGNKKINFSTGTVYDIYKNLDNIKENAEIFFEKLPKAPMDSIVICDTSGSMYNSFDSIGKALSLAYYFAKNSTYAPDSFISFSSNPQLIKINGRNMEESFKNIRRSNWGSNTDLGKVFDLLMNYQGKLPEYLIILTDMEFDVGAAKSRIDFMKKLSERKQKCKIVWWNLTDGRAKTMPEFDESGIFMSGYNGTLLRYLESGFNNEEFIKKLLLNYEQCIEEKNLYHLLKK